MSIQIQSIAHRALTIGGHLFEGFANVEEPIEYSEGDTDLLSTERGKDGLLYGMTEPSYGGMVTVHLHPSSRSVQWLIDEREKLQNAQKNNGDIPTYDGSDKDLVLGDSTTLTHGVLKQCPQRRGYGTFTAQFEFETISTNVAGAKFANTPGRVG